MGSKRPFPWDRVGSPREWDILRTEMGRNGQILASKRLSGDTLERLPKWPPGAFLVSQGNGRIPGILGGIAAVSLGLRRAARSPETEGIYRAGQAGNGVSGTSWKPPALSQGSCQEDGRERRYGRALRERRSARPPRTLCTI